MTDEPYSISFDRFLSVVQASGLLGQQLTVAVTEFEASATSGEGAADAVVFADYLVRHDLLTRWQCDRLLEGRHVGFFVGQYRIMSFVRIEDDHTVYLAEDPVTGRQAHVLSTPPACSPDGKGRVRVVEIE